MHRKVYPIMGSALLVLMILGLTIGCGRAEEPTATSALEPQDAEAYNNRGLAYFDKGNLDQAITDYDQAIALDPRFAPAYLNRGLAYVTTGRYDQALADLGKVLGLDPANAQAYYVCGQVYADLGEREEAIAYLERALDLGLNPEVKQYAEELLKELGRE